MTLQLKLVLSAIALVALCSIGFLTCHAIELSGEIDRERETCQERLERCREASAIRSSKTALAAESERAEQKAAVELGKDTKMLLEALDRIGGTP